VAIMNSNNSQCGRGCVFLFEIEKGLSSKNRSVNELFADISPKKKEALTIYIYICKRDKY
jgi:hypothetical protein